MKIKTTAFILLAAAAMASCSSSKTTLPYFTDIAKVTEGTLPMGDYAPTIKPDDELLITIVSSYPEATAQYNLPVTNPATRAELNLTSTPRQQTHFVNPEGYIDIPYIGKMQVAGLTTEQLKEQIKEIVQKDVSDAVVSVQLVNFNVVVAGEVAKPSTINVTRNRFSVLDALSAAGDLTAYGQRENVLIIREENGQKKFARLNLNSSEVLTSPYYYVQQNDYIYVEPNEIRQANSRYNQDNAYKLTVVSTIVSAASVIASLVIALTFK